MLSSLSNGITWNKGSDVWQGWKKSCCAGTNLNVMLPQKLAATGPLWALDELSCELVVFSLIRHPNSVLLVHAAVLHQPISMSRFSPQIEPLLRRHNNCPSPAKADATSTAGDTAALLWNYCAGAPWRALPKGLSRPHRVAVRCHSDSSIQLPLLLIPPGIRYRREALLGSLIRSTCMMSSDFLCAHSSCAWRRLKPSTALNGIAACYITSTQRAFIRWCRPRSCCSMSCTCRPSTRLCRKVTAFLSLRGSAMAQRPAAQARCLQQ